VHADVNADRGEIVRDDLGCSRAAAPLEAVEHGGVMSAARETTSLGEIGPKWVDVLVAEARHARRQVHLCDVGVRVEGASLGRQSPPVDGVVDCPPHACTCKEWPARVQLDLVDFEHAIDEVALPTVSRGRAAGAVEAFQARALVGSNTVDGVVDM